jgi:hypothetical protein
MSEDESGPDPYALLTPPRGDILSTALENLSDLLGALGVPLVGAIPLFSGRGIARRMEDFRGAVAALFDRLNFDVNQLRERLSEPRLQEQVSRLFYEAARTADRDRLEMLRNAVVNSTMRDIDDAWFIALLECVRDLSVAEIRLLNVLYFGHDPDLRIARAAAGEKDPGPPPENV